jgi:large subunit ribosomal protein L30
VKTIHIKWVRSGIGFDRSQSEVVRSLGLRRLNHVVERPDTPQVRGLVAKVAHLVEVVSGVSERVWGSAPGYMIKAAEPEPASASDLSSQSEAEGSGIRNLPSEIRSEESSSSGGEAESPVLDSTPGLPSTPSQSEEGAPHREQSEKL